MFSLTSYFSSLPLAQTVLSIFGLFSLLVSGAAHASFETYAGKITASDKLSLSPVCRLIMFEKPSAHQPTHQSENAELFNRPAYRMAKNNIHLHHYCYGLMDKHRYLISVTRADKEKYAFHFLSELDYVLRNSDKDWPYFHVLLVDQAEMMKTRGNYPYSLLKIDEALRHKPDYERAYALKSDVYLTMGDKKKAVDTAQEGLEKIPRSKSLRWRLEQLGVKVPLPPEPVADDNKENASGTEKGGGSEPTQQENGNDPPDGSSIATPTATVTPITKEVGQGIETNPNMPPSADSAVKNQDKPVTDTSDKPKDNPYCRFCP